MWPKISLICLQICIYGQHLFVSSRLVYFNCLCDILNRLYTDILNLSHSTSDIFKIWIWRCHSFQGLPFAPVIHPSHGLQACLRSWFLTSWHYPPCSLCSNHTGLLSNAQMRQTHSPPQSLLYLMLPLPGVLAPGSTHGFPFRSQLMSPQGELPSLSQPISFPHLSLSHNLFYFFRIHILIWHLFASLWFSITPTRKQALWEQTCQPFLHCTLQHLAQCLAHCRTSESTE